MFRLLCILAAWSLPILPLRAADQPAPCQPEAQQVVASINQLRAQARRCGATRWPAVAALTWDLSLARSAQQFAQELARRGEISHLGSGTASASLRGRLREAGYLPAQAGENLAAGPESLAEALDLWLASAPHCENLMQAEFVDIGLACVTGPGRYGRYWVAYLARPAPLRSSPDRSP